MTQARQLLDCERCTVYLVDTEDNGSEVRWPLCIVSLGRKFLMKANKNPVHKGGGGIACRYSILHGS